MKSFRKKHSIDEAFIEHAPQDIGDKTFIKNLFLMIKNKKHEFKLLVKSFRLLNENHATKLGKTYGITEELVLQLINIVKESKTDEEAVINLSEFIIAKYEEGKEQINK